MGEKAGEEESLWAVPLSVKSSPGIPPGCASTIHSFSLLSKISRLILSSPLQLLQSEGRTGWKAQKPAIAPKPESTPRELLHQVTSGAQASWKAPPTWAGWGWPRGRKWSVGGEVRAETSSIASVVGFCQLGSGQCSLSPNKPG